MKGRRDKVEAFVVSLGLAFIVNGVLLWLFHNYIMVGIYFIIGGIGLEIPSWCAIYIDMHEGDENV